VECNEHGTAYFESESFVPQFSYSYECSNYFATTFLPVYIYSYALLSFVVPMLSLALLIPSISRNIPTQLRPFLPSHLLPLDDSHHLQHRKQFTNALGVMSSLLYHFCMLLCLGILVPVLGIIIMIHITILVLQYDISIGRYFSPFHTATPATYTTGIPLLPREISPQMFLNEVKSLWRGPYLLAKYVMFLVVMVMSCFLLDQASDHHGWRKGVWVIPSIILIACLPSWLLWKYQPSITRFSASTSFASPSSPSIFRVDVWLGVVGWLMNLSVGSKERGHGSYEILTNKVDPNPNNC
jgi:hypothetical protein